MGASTEGFICLQMWKFSTRCSESQGFFPEKTGLADILLEAYFNLMSKIKEIEKPAHKSSKKQKATFAGRIHSRPPLLPDDDGIVDALRRSAELSSDPTIGISLRDFERRIRHLR